MRIGIDFDNTIANYDAVFRRLAEALLTPPLPATKKGIRDAVRALPDGERLWQGLQGQAYGACMPEAKAFPGFGDFLTRARVRKDEVFIISHKTRFGHFDPQQVDLRQAALAWLQDQRFLGPDFGLTADRIHFEDDREAKIARITSLSSDWFIDDLPEIFAHPAFPKAVRPILFAPDGKTATNGIPVESDWDAICRRIWAS